MELPKISATKLKDIYKTAQEENDDTKLLFCTLIALLSEIKRDQQKGMNGLANMLMPFKKALLGSTMMTFPTDEEEDEEDDS
jgi:hypothetical protein